jgi:hypothetical protein
MERELANGAEPLIDTELRNWNTVARNRALMKMSCANRLRDEYQRRAENRDRARCRSAGFVKPGGHQILRLADWAEFYFDQACRLTARCVKRRLFSAERNHWRRKMPHLNISRLAKPGKSG